MLFPPSPVGYSAHRPSRINQSGQVQEGVSVIELSQLLPFLAASLALNLTPGADMTYVIARSATQGRAAGIAASFGIAAGSVVHTLLAAIGVSGLLQHSETAFLVVKYAGAA